ncbi:MAG: hypothetical protein ACOY46_20680 [Bacillota bacterium]
MKKTTEAMFDLLDQLVPYGVPAQYLLFDSWYAYPKVKKKLSVFTASVGILRSSLK